MTAQKSERLLNLLITLLVSRTYVPKERIRRVVLQYDGQSDEAFEKMFERDKEELRALGVPIEVGSHEAAFEDEPGYRIQRAAFELPQIDLEPDEAAVLGIAARVWQHAGLASATSDALVKLKAAGVDVDRAALAVVQPQLNATEPAFGALWEATQRRTPVTFDYRRPDDTSPVRRRLQPWGVVSARGRWYVVGLDEDRDQPRLFRLSRVVGEVATSGRPGSYQVPPGTDIRALTRSLAPPTPDRTATVLARSGGAHGLRRHATVVAREVPGPDQDRWDRLEVPYASTHGLAEEVLGYGSDLVVESPDEVRAVVLERLRGLAGVS